MSYCIKNRLFLFLSSFCFILESLSAQDIMTRLAHVPSPQAADLGLYGEIPVSYFTGRANITVPIHTFSERGVVLDVNLSYDTSGLLMNKLPGWVGPGWTLNAGGCITRITNGFCDEMTFDPHIDMLFYNYFQSYSYLNLSSVNNNTISSIPLFEHRDLSPDVFYFNFMGKTGHFFLGSDGEWKVNSEDNLVVEFNISVDSNYTIPVYQYYPYNENVGIYYQQPKAIRGFKIYDDSGNKYTFGYTGESIEYSIDLFQTSDTNNRIPWVATSWYLTKVEDRFGTKLYELSYNRGKFLVQLSKSGFSRESFQQQPDGISQENLTPNYFSGTLNAPVHLSSIHTLSGKEVTFLVTKTYLHGSTGKRLYPSLYQNGVLQDFPIDRIPNHNQYPFFYLQSQSPNQQYWNTNHTPDDMFSTIDLPQLKRIDIFSESTLSSKTYTLKYDTVGRPHLSSMDIKLSEQKIGSYKFLYHNYGAVPADYLTQSVDHWGYYRAQSQQVPYTFIDEGGNVYEIPNSGLDPTNYPLALDNYYNSRMPKFSNTLNGMLEKIIFPTGGMSKFSYELNEYSSYISKDRQSAIPYIGVAGGLRIKSIADYTDTLGITPVKKRTFTYATPSTGVPSGQLFKMPQYYWEWHKNSNYIQEYLSVPVFPLSTTEGYHVGYSYVTETMLDGSKHRYHYNNFTDIKDRPADLNLAPSSTGTPYDRFGELGFMRGKLLTEDVFDSDGILRLHHSYVYRQDSLNYLQEFSYASSVTSVMALNDAGCIYKQFYHKYDLAKETTITYPQNGFICDTIAYTMSQLNYFPGLRKCITEQHSRSGFRYKKSYEYGHFAEDTCFTPLLSTTSYYNNYFMGVEKTNYSLYNGHYQPSSETKSITSGIEDTTVIYNGYTATGLLDSYTKKGKYPTLLFWNNKDQLLATVTSPFNRAAYTCFEEIYNPDPFLGPSNAPSPVDVLKVQNQSIFAIPRAIASTYVYDSWGRPYASANGNGNVTYYLYDQHGRLTEIQDENHNTIQRFTYHYSTGSNNNQ